MAQRDGLNWAAPKSDRLRIATGALTERHIIHEQIQVRRDGRPFLSIRPYMRIVARLAPVPARNSDVIPPLNPLRLFASASTTPGKASEDGSDGPGEVSLRVTELLTGTLPANDGLELDANEAQEIIRQMIEDEPEPPAAVLSLGTDPTAGLTPS